MFGDLLGNFEEQQKKMKVALAEITVEAEAGDGAIQVKADANRQILNISIDKEKIDPQDTEQIEDLLLVAINRALEMAAEKEAEEGQSLLKDMMPPGLGGLGDMFK